MRVPLSLLSLGVVALVAGCATDSGATTEISPAEATTSEPPSAHELAVGMCLNDVSSPLGAELAEIPSVDCAESHESEVFAQIPINTETYPGVDEINDLAATECEAAFGEFIGLDYRVSTLSFHYYYPEFSQWAEGDTTMYCVVFDPDSPSVGSLRDAAR